LHILTHLSQLQLPALDLRTHIIVPTNELIIDKNHWDCVPVVFGCCLLPLFVALSGLGVDPGELLAVLLEELFGVDAVWAVVGSEDYDFHFLMVSN
jgi:hypothetical protein